MKWLNIKARVAFATPLNKTVTDIGACFAEKISWRTVFKQIKTMWPLH